MSLTFEKFYNGLSPQLVTYLEALRQTYKVDADQLFGAMYLHMKDPQLNLAQFGLDKLAAQAHKELTYKGTLCGFRDGASGWWKL